MTSPDYEFHLGKNRYLRGSGWRGIVALMLFLTAAVAMITSFSVATANLHQIADLKLPW
jgi:hypothetical protein